MAVSGQLWPTTKSSEPFLQRCWSTWVSDQANPKMGNKARVLDCRHLEPL